SQRTAYGVVALGVNSRSQRQIQIPSVTLHRSQRQPRTNCAMVHPALAVGSDLGRSACPLGGRDATPVVRQSDCAYDACVVGLVFTRHLTGTAKRTMRKITCAPSRMVCQV